MGVGGTHMLVVALCIGYLVGSFPTAVVLSRLFTGDDIRAHGSGNPGASNVARTYGMKLGVVVGFLDIVKGCLPVLVARRFGLPDSGLALTAMIAVLGHDYSIFLRMHGGKGVATTLGAGLGLSIFAGSLAMVVWVGVILATRYSSLASLVSLGTLPIFIALTGGSPAFVVGTVALFVLAVWKHLDNIYRL